MALEIQIVVWGNHKNMAGVMSPPLDNWMSNSNTDINKQ